MMRALGFIIVLYAISNMMSEPFQAFEDALAATFQTVEVAAVVSQEQMVDVSN